jgi:xanthine dehydrogenase YagR molybdenum-binding subunit
MAQPGQVRDGRWLVGMGVAAAFRNNLVTKSAARVRLDNRGVVTVETDMTDIGTGSYTIIAQTAAETMGVPLAKVFVRLGDSAFPGLVRLGRAVGRQQLHGGRLRRLHEAARGRRQKLGIRQAMRSSPTAWCAPAIAAVPLAEAAGARAGGRRLHGVRRPRQEVPAVDLRRALRRSRRRRYTGEIRVRRMLAVCAAGRILNPKAARSQVIGAMTMGVGAALMEELAVDTRRGFFVNHDLAGYEVPVHADIPHQDVIFLDETDPISSPMKAKGVGELGICGWRGGRQCDLQRDRRAGARLPDHAGQDS